MITKEPALKGIDWPLVVNAISHFTTSEHAKLLVSQLSPFTSKGLAEKSFNQISEAQSLLEKGQRPFMESLDIYTHWSKSLQKKSILKILEIKDIHHFCIEVLALNEFFEPHCGPWVTGLKEKILTPRMSFTP